MNGGREGEVERTANRGQDPRQEEGIPSPSLQSCLMKRGVREHPCLFLQPGRSAQEANLHSINKAYICDQCTYYS